MSYPADQGLRPMHTWERLVLYGLMGLAVEVMFTATYEVVFGIFDSRLRGHTYLWMHPIWAGAVYGVEWGGPRMKGLGWPWPVRGLAWVATAFAFEYGSGFVLRATVGHAPWDYSDAAFNVHGLIRLDYAGFWFLSGLTFERVTALARGLRF